MNMSRVMAGLAAFSLLTAAASTASIAAASTPRSAFPRPADPDAVLPADTNPAPAVRAHAIDAALAAARGAAGRFGANAADGYQARTVAVDWSGVTHVRFERTHAGLRVDGGQVVVELAPSGKLLALTSEVTQPIAVPARPRLSVDQARQRARTAARGTVTALSTPSLMIEGGPGRTPRLAFETVVSGVRPDGQTPSRLHVIVDADTGAVLSTRDEVETEEGTGNGIYDGSVKLETTQGGSGYQMIDPTHGNGQTTNLNHATDGSGDVFTNSSNTWGSGDNNDPASAGVDSHFGAGATWDFYKKTENRDGIFGDGRGVPSRDHYGDNYENAFWDGQQMTYGDGNGNSKPLTEIDVSAHEMTHGVSGALVNWGGDGETGGLNEGTSDIFGMMVKFNANLASDPAKYTMGDKLDFRGDGKPTRYMYQPSLDGNSPDCYDASNVPSDPHFAMGPLTHWFFLLAEGSGDTAYGHSPTCDNSTLKGIGREKAAKIWYQALASHANSNENYASARTDSIAAATDLFGADSAEGKAVAAAWTAVAVNG
jgi:Zn-dependent metalloprotease